MTLDGSPEAGLCDPCSLSTSMSSPSYLSQQSLQKPILLCPCFGEGFPCFPCVLYQLSLSPKDLNLAVLLSTFDQVDNVHMDLNAKCLLDVVS